MKTPYSIFVVILAAVAGCQPSTPPAEQAATPERDDLGFKTDKAYRVCDVEFTDHVDENGETLTGNHLNVDDVVVINNVEPLVTRVVFNRVSAQSRELGLPQTEDVLMVKSVPGLAAVRPFDHTKGGTPSQSQHYVSIENVSQSYERDRPGASCDGTDIIAIRFCFFTSGDEGSGWTCSGDLPHYGDVHAET